MSAGVHRVEHLRGKRLSGAFKIREVLRAIAALEKRGKGPWPTRTIAHLTSLSLAETRAVLYHLWTVRKIVEPADYPTRRLSWRRVSGSRKRRRRLA